jgi:DNA-binding MarR family transcriptional regulator
LEQGPHVGGMMRIGLQWVREQIHAGVAAAGYEDVNPAHVQVFQYPSPDGLHPSELADKLQITKQSVNDLLGHLERFGYITREPDPNDGRARVIRLTSKGRELQSVIYSQAQAAELRVADLLGTRRFAQLRSGLEELTRRLDSVS